MTAIGRCAAAARRRRVAAGPLAAALALAVLVAAMPARSAADNTSTALEAAGWDESSPGLLTSLPARTAQAGKDGVAGEFVLAPGTDLVWDRRFRGPSGAGPAVEIEMFADGANAGSEDYRVRGARFPVSVTAVFGRDSWKVGVRTRILDFFAGFWYGFRPGGIRLTYAAGSVAPVGSMYRLGDEETVFILVGDEERGKRIAVRRDFAADFRAAYGRDPRGPVTRLIVSAERPSREKGTIKAGIRLRFTGE